jgi:hypothetical protein
MERRTLFSGNQIVLISGELILDLELLETSKWVEYNTHG